MVAGDWRQDLLALVSASDPELFPLCVYKADPPTSAVWPAHLPRSQEIADFYAACNGGFIADFNWYALEQVAPETDRWIQTGVGYYADGTNALDAGRHVALAVDSAGAPLIWDAQTDLVATFFFKGGDWEPLGMTFGKYLGYLFSAADADTMWAEALRQLNALHGDDAS